MSKRRKIVFEPRYSLWAFFSLCVLFFAGWFVAHLGPMAAWCIFSLSFIVYVCLLVDLLRWALWPKDLDKRIKESIDEGEDVFNAYAVTYPFSFCGFFALCSFCIFMIFGESAYANATVGFGDWAMYLVDQVFRAVMFDLAEIFYLDLSPIEHQPKFLICLFVLSFRTAAGISLLSLVIVSSRHVIDRISTKHN